MPPRGERDEAKNLIRIVLTDDVEIATRVGVNIAGQGELGTVEFDADRHVLAIVIRNADQQVPRLMSGADDWRIFASPADGSLIVELVPGSARRPPRFDAPLLIQGAPALNFLYDEAHLLHLIVIRNPDQRLHPGFTTGGN
jgi:hypothetical protein